MTSGHRFASPFNAVAGNTSQLLDLLDQKQEAVRERQRADALTPQTALDWFLVGYERGFHEDDIALLELV